MVPEFVARTGGSKWNRALPGISNTRLKVPQTRAERWKCGIITAYTRRFKGGMPVFEMNSKFAPRGDQPQAIEKLSQGVADGLSQQVLLGVTGSGKTFTMANIIKNAQRPTLIIAHNKTLAAQLCRRVPRVFPGQRGGATSSPTTTTTSPRPIFPPPTPSSRRTRRSTTKSTACATARPPALTERRDVIIVASVSCIYGLGNPEEYEGLSYQPARGHADGPRRG